MKTANKHEYIDRRMVILTIDNCISSMTPEEYDACRLTLDDLKNFIRTFAATDVEPVIRCRRCEYARQTLDKTLCCKRHDYATVEKDYYCAYGEKSKSPIEMKGWVL